MVFCRLLWSLFAVWLRGQNQVSSAYTFKLFFPLLGLALHGWAYLAILWSSRNLWLPVACRYCECKVWCVHISSTYAFKLLSFFSSLLHHWTWLCTCLFYASLKAQGSSGCLWCIYQHNYWISGPPSPPPSFEGFVQGGSTFSWLRNSLPVVMYHKEYVGWEHLNHILHACIPTCTCM